MANDVEKIKWLGPEYYTKGDSLYYVTADARHIKLSELSLNVTSGVLTGKDEGVVTNGR